MQEVYLGTGGCITIKHSVSDWNFSGKLSRPVDEPPDQLPVSTSNDGVVEQDPTAKGF